ncbi:hypothetical protein NXX24_21140 [Bacteroides fragilis]|nr:hypothetical protein [Bacteroides fragilis]
MNEVFKNSGCKHTIFREKQYKF